jgi:MATE family multidrug resistance protein
LAPGLIANFSDRTSKRISISPLDADQRFTRKEILHLAMPAVVEQLIRFSSGIVDTFLMGHLGAAPLAILGFSNQLFLLGTVWISPVIVGSGVLAAQAIGRGDRKGAHRVLGQAIWLSVGLGIGLLCIGMVFAPQALNLIGAQDPVVRQGTAFLRLLFLNMPLFFLVFVVNSCLRGAGDTRTPMLIVLFEMIVRVFSATVLVNGLFGFPHIGTQGVPVGAILGQLSGFIALLYWMGRRRLAFNLKEISWAIDRPTIIAILRLGIPSGGEQLALRLGQAVNIRVLAGLGTIGYAAYLVGFNAISVALTVGVGFTVAATTIVGQTIGAGNPQAARNGAIQTWVMAMIAMGFIGVGLAVGVREILNIFTNDQRVISLAILPLQLVAIVLPAEATNQTLSGAFRGLGDTRWPFLITTVGNWLLRLPLTLILISNYGLLGAWYAVMIEISIRALLNIWKLLSLDWFEVVYSARLGVDR